MAEITALVRLLTEPSAVALSTFAVIITAGGFRLWHLIERKFDDLDDRFDKFEYEIDSVRGCITDIDAKLDRDMKRLNEMEEILFRLLQGVVELGANGPVKKCLERIIAGGRWQ
jgi:hypothetical protein